MTIGLQNKRKPGRVSASFGGTAAVAWHQLKLVSERQQDELDDADPRAADERLQLACQAENAVRLFTEHAARAEVSLRYVLSIQRPLRIVQRQDHDLTWFGQHQSRLSS